MGVGRRSPWPRRGYLGRVPARVSVLAAVLAAGALRAGEPPIRCAARPAARLPGGQRVEPARRPARRSAPNSARDHGGDRGGQPLHPDFGTRYGIPYTTVARRPAPRAGLLRLRRRVRRRPVPDPRATSRSRAAAPARRRTRHVSDSHALTVDHDAAASTSSSTPSERDALAGRQSGAIVEPALEPAAPAGLDVRRRGRAADPARASRARTTCGRGSIDHALRFTVRADAPARSSARGAPLRLRADRPRTSRRWGLRLRLQASFDVSRLPPPGAHRPAGALKRYGMLVADNGADWFVTGAPSPRWDNDDLHTLARVRGAGLRGRRRRGELPRAFGYPHPDPPGRPGCGAHRHGMVDELKRLDSRKVCWPSDYLQRQPATGAGSRSCSWRGPVPRRARRVDRQRRAAPDPAGPRLLATRTCSGSSTPTR